MPQHTSAEGLVYACPTHSHDMSVYELWFVHGLLPVTEVLCDLGELLVRGGNFCKQSTMSIGRKRTSQTKRTSVSQSCN